jgi:hypothetical protein
VRVSCKPVAAVQVSEGVIEFSVGEESGVAGDG